MNIETNTIRCKVFLSWNEDAKEFRGRWERLLMQEGKYWFEPTIGRIVLTDDLSADYHIIINAPKSGDQYDPAKAIFLRMEPKIHDYMFNGLNNPQPTQYRYLAHEYNALEWHLDRSYSQFMNDLKGPALPKTKVISTVTSGLNRDLGHRLRLEFLKYADKLPNFDFYGRDPSPLKSYRGPLPRLNKNDALLPYRYTIACENCQEEGYVTEKLIDGILAECVVFYYGDPSATKLIDPQAFIFLDLEKPEQSLKLIQQAIANDEYSKRIGIIRQMKLKILSELQVMPMLARSIRAIQQQDVTFKSYFSNPKSLWRLLHADKFPPGLRGSFVDKLKGESPVNFGDAIAIKFNTALPSQLSNYPARLNSKLTIVTAYYTLKSKRPNALYLEWCQYFCQFDCNMIIFTDLVNYNFFRKLRSPHNTRIYLKELEDFECNKISGYWKYCSSIDQETNHSPELYMLWHERHVSLMEQAVKVNPFNSDYFLWADIGSVRGKGMFDLIKTFPNESKLMQVLRPDKFVLSRPITNPMPCLEVSNKGILKVLENTPEGKSCAIYDQLQGGFLAGHKDLWSKWKIRYCEHLQRFIDSGTYGGKDQAIITNIYFTDPEPDKRYILLQGVRNISGLEIDPWFTNFYRFC